ncbi:hypothetical protein NYO91_00245 [Arhodomonas aquaeolei]|uniref:hypothetical protein n=1 Tax=Arhodomonas aquaeolei TaxID=2369 RepID=UPI0021687E6B|nr:hypothetical protein [Arhodomonas aquaeolei]MCS4502497.1 hypothetical protein [Arhodomonas aquaeolei]
MSKKSILSSSFWLLAGEGGQRFGSLFLFLAYVPWLGIEAAGQIMVAYAYAMSVWLFIDLGLGLYGTKMVASANTDNASVQLSVGVERGLLGLAGSVAYVVITYSISAASLPVALGFGMYLFFRAASVDWRLRGESRFRELAMVAVMATITQILFGFFAVQPDAWRYTATIPWALFSVIFFVGTWSVAGARLAVRQVRVSRHFRFDNLKKSYLFSASNGASVLFQQSPVLVLSYIGDSGNVASFALVHRVAMSLLFFYQIIGAAVFPKLVRASEYSFRRSVHIAANMSFAFVALGASLMASVFLVVFIGGFFAQYVEGTSFPVVLSFGAFVVFRGLRVAPARLLLGSGGERRYAGSMLVALIGFLLCLFIVDALGILGANSIAIAFVTIEALLVSWLWAVIVRKFVRGEMS